jgi:hypothetical protein
MIDIASINTFLQIIAFVLYSAIEVRFVLDARRGFVHISDSGILITDWRGREKEITWHGITSLQAYGGWRILVLAGEKKRYAINPWLEDRKILLDEITARAELTKARKGWLSIIYTRPTG